MLILNDWEGTFTETRMVNNTRVSAVCASTFESIIEACIFEVGDHLYVGDWNPIDIKACGKDTEPGVPMETVEMVGGGGMLPSSEEFHVAASMLAEIVVGSGTIESRQQLALLLGVFSRMAAMKLGVGTAHRPETVVIVSISRVIIVLWSLLLAGGCVVNLRERLLVVKAFIPSTAWDWFAVGARECSGGEDISCSGPPSHQAYAARYGLGKPWEKRGVTTQHLGWTTEQCKYEGGEIGGKEPASHRPGTAT